MPNNLNLYIEKKVEKYYSKLNINRSLLGSEYLCEAIKLTIEDQTLLHKGLTTRLYPLIAEKYCVSPLQVERAIRNLIKTSFEREDFCHNFSDFSDFYFGENKFQKPSNGELISLCAWRMKLRMQEDGIYIEQ